MVGGLQETVLRFKFHQNWSSGFRAHWFGHWLIQQPVLPYQAIWYTKKTSQF